MLLPKFRNMPTGNSSHDRPAYLSKSDFKIARSCATKLYYKKLHYPSTLEADPYLEMLADGGFMVGKLAQLQYPDGVLVASLDPWAAVEETNRLLQRDKVTIFEAAIYHQHRLVRIDILRKACNCFELIEVKSKAADSDEFGAGTMFVGARGGIRSEWRGYLEDITYQAMVLKAAIPTAIVKCFLLTPDKAKSARLDNLCQRFRLKRDGKTVEVDVVGEVPDLQAENILSCFAVDAEVHRLEDEVAVSSERFIGGLVPSLRKLPSQIGYGCRGCEYRVHDEAKPNGFHDCWGPLARVRPHVFDLYQLRHAKNRDGSMVIDELVKKQQASLFDIPVGACSTAHGPRQKIQIRHTKAGTEWIASSLRTRLAALEGPLHFIDFETSAMALPYHRGMRPFELVAFQWSCHTLQHSGAEPVHQEWINCEQSYPNVEFARTLREAVGDKGAILTWSNHERTTLRTIASKIEAYFPAEADLARWLRCVTAGNRIVDMCALAKEGYFHPEMKGSLSIKYVLPAIWKSNSRQREMPWFRKYAATRNGVVLNPYETLPPLPIGSKEELVNEGTGAMRAYQSMLYGKESANSMTRENWKRLLLQYCELDTMAMVVVFEHWLHHAA